MVDDKGRATEGSAFFSMVRKPKVSQEVLVATIPFRVEVIQHSLKQLEKEGLVVKRGKDISIA